MSNIARFKLADGFSKSSGLTELTHREVVKSAVMNGATSNNLSLLIDDLRRRPKVERMTSTKTRNGVVAIKTTVEAGDNPLVSEVALADQVSRAIRAGENKRFNLLLPNEIMKLIPPSRRDLLAIEVAEYITQLREAIIREAFPDADELLEKYALYETNPDGGLNYVDTKETFKSAAKKGLI